MTVQIGKKGQIHQKKTHISTGGCRFVQLVYLERPAQLFYGDILLDHLVESGTAKGRRKKKKVCWLLSTPQQHKTTEMDSGTSTSQSINPSIRPSIDRSINQSINQSITQSTIPSNQSTNQSNQSTNQSMVLGCKKSTPIWRVEKIQTHGYQWRKNI